ncbi:ROK family protein [Naasia sp. SYSU D00057]|uniref:ROK family protein n=1 Tax=Naasia sp. SYSU D00057 TaxID=2817380 RepID=UPI001B31391B|nr:ROK family protein [Naasia sp. SYSU D00057]
MTTHAQPRTRWPELGHAGGLVLLELLLHGAQSRVRLAENVGLSRASLSRIARELLDLGLVVEGDVELRESRGRPPETLHLRPEAAHFLGVKLTGDTLYAVVTDLSARVVEQRAVPLPSRGVDTVVALLTEVAADLSAGATAPVAIGICLAGDVLRSGPDLVVRRSSFLGWNEDVPLAALVGPATGLPVTVSNDVHALTAAHHWFGSGVAYEPLVVYGLGAGIGSGVVVGGELLEGAHGRTGRIGHLRVGGTGRVCENGHDDCVHSFVTIPSIEFNAGVAPGDYATALRRARAGEARAVDAFRRAAFALGGIIAESVNAFDPQMVSVMGEGRDMLDIAPQELRRALLEYLEQGDVDEVRIERPPFDFSLYARGAAVSAMRALLAG